MRQVLLVALLLGLAACAAQPGDASPDRSAASSPAADAAGGGGSSPTENDLTVEVDRGDGSAIESYTLVCAGVVDGTHPAAQEACDHLLAMADPFAPIPADAICTQVYDGPQTARVTGRWHGDPVDLELGRNNGCRTAQWDGLGPLLPSA